MDQCLIDITDVPGKVELGEEVILFGGTQKNAMQADDLAQRMNTINYEITTSLTGRVPRVGV